MRRNGRHVDSSNVNRRTREAQETQELDEKERQTRTQRIDPKLSQSGWSVVPFSGADLAAYKSAAVEEFPTTNGPADYALCDRAVALGAVEAKKVTLGPQNVLTQAQRYSEGFTASPLAYGDGYRVPFLYSTNGEVIWFQDVRHAPNRSRKIARFHTPAALHELLGRDQGAAVAKLPSIPYHGLLRDYQIECHQAVEEAIAIGKQKMLVAMATGTGKTLTMVSEVYRLMKSGTARRILFLVDRRSLAAQAVRAFSSFEAEPGLKFDKLYEVYSQRFQKDDFEEGEAFDPKVLPNKYLTDPQPGHAFAYICTIQRMAMNLFGKEAGFDVGDEPKDEDADKLDIPIHAFDLIIADECHRGYSRKELSTWRDTLDYFDAMKIGLTATPAAHTVAYFNQVSYRYDYERAVAEGHLVDYDVVNIKSNVRLHGVFLKEGESVSEIDTETGVEQLDLLEDEPKRRSPRPTPTARFSRRSRSTPSRTSRKRGASRRRSFSRTTTCRTPRTPTSWSSSPVTSSDAATPSCPRLPAASTDRCDASASSATVRILASP